MDKDVVIIADPEQLRRVINNIVGNSAQYMNKKNGFILVSHDRSFLDDCIDHVLSINRTNINIEKGIFLDVVLSINLLIKLGNIGLVCILSSNILTLSPAVAQYSTSGYQ